MMFFNIDIIDSSFPLILLSLLIDIFETIKVEDKEWIFAEIWELGERPGREWDFVPDSFFNIEVEADDDRPV